MLKNKKGITLIALVVTIVVLLILAGVSISLIINNNGIIQRSKDAREQYGQARENEQADLDNVSEWINEQAGIKSEVNWNKVLNEANSNPDNYKHPDQSSTNKDIGIGTDGKPVNLDLWTYVVVYRNKISLGHNNACQASSPGYQNSDIVNGKIQGKVPQYIKVSGADEFYEVTTMNYTFGGCSSLITAPEIPSGVTEMISTFYGCTGLITAPEIPSSVTYMYGTFAGCTSLTKAPKIPSKVKNISSAFSNCTSLTTAPEIPSKVKNMTSTFFGCMALTTAPKIPSSVTNMQRTFEGCTTLITAPEIPSNVTDMIGTFEGCTTLITAPEIPSSVTNMMETFTNCTNLTTAPEIPSSVTDMKSTFSGCTSLTTAPVIPSSVTNMIETFTNCTSLTGNLVINANPRYQYKNCLYNASTAAGTNLVVSGTSTLLDEIIATKSENSNITKRN